MKTWKGTRWLIWKCQESRMLLRASPETTHIRDYRKLLRAYLNTTYIPHTFGIAIFRH